MSSEKRQRAMLENLNAKEQIAPAATARWTHLLPLHLLIHIASWLDAKSLARLQCSARPWLDIPAVRLEPLWRTMYLREFESESTHDAKIAATDSTLWRARVVNRATTERNRAMMIPQRTTVTFVQVPCCWSGDKRQLSSGSIRTARHPRARTA